MEQRRKTFTQENLTAVIGKDSSRPLRPYFFRPDLTNRSRVIKVQREQRKKTFFFNNFFLRNYSTQENRSWVIGKGSSRPVRTYFFRPDRTNRSQVITEPSYNGLNVTKEKKHFSLTIFFSETIAPRRTGLGSLERARRALYAHIFFVQIGPIGAKTQENRSGVIGKDSSRPLRPYFFLPDWTNRSRVITHLEEPERGNKGKKHFPLTIFLSETIAPRRTGLGSLERARRALYAHIFFVQIGPIGAKVQRRKTLYLTIFSSETIAPRRTGPGSLERARRALYAHIFFVQIGPIKAEL
ncbi:hypothetical protein V1477_017846 [Vespula maculifrons]|uniref:Ribosomal protein S3 n=1 Tax=Vespula maculifrons TaxID=7453 RepID=A0ABD2AZI8_VESMC